jgi:hypothetical protein
MSSLDKVLRLSAQPQSPEPDGVRELSQAVALALTMACDTSDPQEAARMTLAARKLAAELSGMLGREKISVESRIAAAAPVLAGEVICAVAGDGENFQLAVLTQAQRDRYATTGVALSGGAYPIPDKGHLAAAVARYKQGAHAGHSAGSIKSHILKRAKALGVSVSLTVMEDLASGEASVFLAAPPAGGNDIPMHHAPFTGTHEHAHSVTMTHGHAHSHQDDNSHGSPVHGNNAAQKAWAAKGQSARRDW